MFLYMNSLLAYIHVADEVWRWKQKKAFYKAFYKVGDCMLTENQFMFDKLYYKRFCDSNYFENEMLQDKAVHIQLQHTTNIQPHMSVWKPSGIRAPDFLAIKEPRAHTTDTKPLITPSNASPRCSSWISWAMEEESLVHFSCVSDINAPREKEDPTDVKIFSGFCISENNLLTFRPDDDWSVQSNCQQVIFQAKVGNR